MRLCELERIIQKGKDTFVEVGTALSEIRASRLYRSSHETFEAYFQERLGLEKSHVKQLMDSAKVINNLKTSAMAELPNNERQTRPLAKLPAEQQPAAWERAQEIAGSSRKSIKRAGAGTWSLSFGIMREAVIGLTGKVLNYPRFRHVFGLLCS